jgi:hypothetical protein
MWLAMEKALIQRIRFSATRPGADRIHYVNAEDIRVLLSRLPVEVWHRLRTVHFNDRSRGGRILGYVNRGRREIALCAQPPRMSMRPRGHSPETFGAKRSQKWPVLAVRRFMLYDVFLHELGHLQLINEKARSARLKFAREKLAEDFAVRWRKELWTAPFVHPDPVHNPPASEENTQI